MFDLVIANAVIVSAANRYVPFIGSIAIEQGRLVYVGEKNFLPSEAYTYEDVEGDIVMPGLFNNHCHAEMSIMRGIGDGMTLLEQKQVFPISIGFEIIVRMMSVLLLANLLIVKHYDLAPLF